MWWLFLHQLGTDADMHYSVLDEKVTSSQYPACGGGTTTLCWNDPPNYSGDVLGKLDRVCSWDASTYYKHGLVSAPSIAADCVEVDSNVGCLARTSSGLDGAFYSLASARKPFLNLFWASESTGMFRIAPYERKFGYAMFEFVGARSESTVLGYDPRERTWVLWGVSRCATHLNQTTPQGPGTTKPISDLL
jgi:hypothetical protein